MNYGDYIGDKDSVDFPIASMALVTTLPTSSLTALLTVCIYELATRAKETPRKVLASAQRSTTSDEDWVSTVRDWFWLETAYRTPEPEGVRDGND